jgi:hypothetical protein
MKHYLFSIGILPVILLLSFSARAQTTGQPVLARRSAPVAKAKNISPGVLKPSSKEDASIKKSTADSMQKAHPTELKRVDHYPGLKTQYSQNTK